MLEIGRDGSHRHTRLDGEEVDADAPRLAQWPFIVPAKRWAQSAFQAEEGAGPTIFMSTSWPQNFPPLPCSRTKFVSRVVR
jgi:hypothetical protein